MKLNNHQVDIISKMLIKTLKVSKRNFQEILDHYCETIERSVSVNKNTFEKVMEETFDNLNKSEIKKINKKLNTLYFRNYAFKSLLILGLIFLFLFFYITIFNKSNNPEQNNIKEIPTFEIMDTINIWPLKNNLYVSSKFGNRIHPFYKVEKFHNGIDIPAKEYERVFSIANGIVINAGYSDLKGNYIEIQHNEIFQSIYFHLSEIDVKINDKIEVRQQIGKVGSGNLNNQSHLHFEIKKNGTNVDPLLYIRA